MRTTIFRQPPRKSDDVVLSKKHKGRCEPIFYKDWGINADLLAFIKD
jgi:hypothetical protein